MTWQEHHTNPEQLYQQFNIEMPTKVIDFSDNINAIKQEEKIDIHLSDEYPDDDVIELRKMISKQEGFLVENILFGNGINEMIYLVSSYYKNKVVAILHPTHSEYETPLKAYQAKIDKIFNFNEIKKETSAIIICNPNNPTGHYFDDETIKNLAIKLEKENTDLIIDETYIDFINQKHQTLNIRKLKNVYILRSLTKFYHMSDLPSAYIISHEDNIKQIQLRQLTKSVNSFAQLVAYHYLSDTEFVKKTKDYYQKERLRVFIKLKEIGLEFEKSVTNFFMLKVMDDEKLIRYLLTQGIVVNHTRDILGLDGKYIGITLKSVEDDNKLLDALKHYVNHY